MIGQIRSAAKNILLDEDNAKLALLRQEKNADIAAVLSPAELADYQVRSSPLTRAIVRQLGDFNPTDSEFRAVYQAYARISDNYADANLGSLDVSEIEGRRADFVAELNRGLGADRAADYFRESSPDYQQLKQLTQSAGLPETTAADVFRMRSQTATASQQIANDASLTAAEKVTALKQLAANTRLQVSAELGSAAPQFERTINQWMAPLEHGGLVSFDPTMVIVTNEQNTLRLGGSPRWHPIDARARNHP